MENGRQSTLVPNVINSPFYYATGSGRHSMIEKGQR
jgi:hypothetical protein